MKLQITPTRKGLAAIYRQEIIQDVTLFTSQSAVMFYDKFFSSLDFFKASGQERLWVRNGNSAVNLNTLAHISALAVALAAVLHGSHSYRSAKQLRRSA